MQPSQVVCVTIARVACRCHLSLAVSAATGVGASYLARHVADKPIRAIKYKLYGTPKYRVQVQCVEMETFKRL